MNQGANQLTEMDKRAMKRHPIAFISFSVSRELIVTSILDHESNRLVASDQCCWVATSLTFILILNLR